MGSMVGVGVSPPPNHTPTSLADGSTPGLVDSVASLLRVYVISSENGIVFSPGPGGRRQYIGDVEGSILLLGSQRWSSRGRHACCASSASGDPALAHATRRTREVAAAAAAAAAASTDDARCDARAWLMPRHTARTTLSCASFASISPSHAHGGARSLVYSLA